MQLRVATLNLLINTEIHNDKNTATTIIDIALRKGMKPTVKGAVLAVLTVAAALLIAYPALCFNYRTPVVLKSAGIVNSSALSWVRGVEPAKKEKDLETDRGREDDGECDFFEGQWVWDENYPLYESKDCPFMDGGFKCSENGRPDRFYTKWRWQPKRCNLTRFNAKEMLKRLRNKRLVFAGDSIGRNQWESLLCMLSSAVSDKNSIYEVNGNLITKHTGFLIFKFKDYNCTVEYYRSPFLVRHGRAPRGVTKEVVTTIRLDHLDFMVKRWKDADVLILNSGHWWTYDKTVKQGHYFQEKDSVKMEMSVDEAYQRAMKTVLEWVYVEVDTSKTQVYFRTYSPVHFRYGDWKNGGSCHLETQPELNTSNLQLNSWSHLLSPFSNASPKHSNSVQNQELEVLNITHMTAQRRDGHLSLYYMGPTIRAPLHRQDCSHWCLPGVPDAWNELLYAIFLRREQRVESKLDLAPR